MNAVYRRDVATEYLTWINLELRKMAERRQRIEEEQGRLFTKIVKARSYLAAGFAGIAVVVCQFFWP